ncbi:hypothetical protein [uncultured Jatrophihabitans sp.]
MFGALAPPIPRYSLDSLWADDIKLHRARLQSQTDHKVHRAEGSGSPFG